MKHLKGYIYALIDPITHEIRYIGKTDRTNNRISAYKNRKHPQSKRMKKWLESIDYKPEMVVFQEVSDHIAARVMEIYWIRHFKNLGCDLLNTYTS